VEKIKELEKEGYHFEAAEASFELLCKRHFGLVRNYFDLDAYRVLIAKRSTDELPVSEATVRLSVGGVKGTYRIFGQRSSQWRLRQGS
jgi:2-isopropylmalate synthase